MHSNYAKPIYEAEKQLDYFKHLSRLEEITHQRAKQVQQRDTIKQMHRIRDKSLIFHKSRHQKSLNRQNEKIMNRLLDISKRRGSSLTVTQPQYKIQSFENPARRRRQREISLKNMTLAGRLLDVQSQFDPQVQRKGIQQYEKIKKTMEHNKHLGLPSLPELNHSRTPQLSAASHHYLGDSQH